MVAHTSSVSFWGVVWSTRSVIVYTEGVLSGPELEMQKAGGGLA